MIRLNDLCARYGYDSKGVARKVGDFVVLPCGHYSPIDALELNFWEQDYPVCQECGAKTD